MLKIILMKQWSYKIRQMFRAVFRKKNAYGDNHTRAWKFWNIKSHLAAKCMLLLVVCFINNMKIKIENILFQKCVCSKSSVFIKCYLCKSFLRNRLLWERIYGCFFPNTGNKVKYSSSDIPGILLAGCEETIK